MRKFLFLVAATVSGAALAEGGGDGLAEQNDYNAWHFRIGTVMSPRVRVRVRGPRQFAQTPAASASRRSGSGGDVAADPSAGFVDREYVDGYVKPDEGTEDPDSMISGLTWYWGAKDVAAQYSDGRMEFHTDSTKWSESVSSSAYSSGSGFESDRDILLGVEAMGGWTFLSDETFDAALDAGFRFYGSGDLKAESLYGTSVTTKRSSSRYVDSYDASGWTDVPSGSYDGTPGGPGRIIGAMPTRREESTGSSSSTETHYYRSSSRLDYRIWDVRLGPTAGWKATDWLTIRSGVYGLIGLVDAKLDSPRSTAGGSRSCRSSECDAVFGVAAALSAQVNLTENLFIVGGAEYDWWSDSVSLKTGGTDAHIKLSDFSVSLSLGIEF